MLRRAISKTAALLAVPVLTLFLCACGDKTPVEPQQLKVFSGAEQCTGPGEEFASDLLVHAYGREKNSASGKVVPAAGVKLIFRAEKGSDLQITPSEVITRGDGLASVKIKAGKNVGDQYLTVYPEGKAEKALRLRFISGVKILGNAGDREGQAGKKLAKEIGIRLANADGSPRSGVPVYFTSANLKLGTEKVLTDAKGEAKTAVTLKGPASTVLPMVINSTLAGSAPTAAKCSKAFCGAKQRHCGYAAMICGTPSGSK
jgi:hypothetical protein